MNFVAPRACVPYMKILRFKTSMGPHRMTELLIEKRFGKSS
jgi:hypothetical protein